MHNKCVCHVSHPKPCLKCDTPIDCAYGHKCTMKSLNATMTFKLVFTRFSVNKWCDYCGWLLSIILNCCDLAQDLTLNQQSNLLAKLFSEIILLLRFLKSLNTVFKINFILVLIPLRRIRYTTPQKNPKNWTTKTGVHHGPLQCIMISIYCVQYCV